MKRTAWSPPKTTRKRRRLLLALTTPKRGRRLPHLEDAPRLLRFVDFARMALAAGVTPQNLGDGRWRLQGRLTVDYWPKHPTGPLVFVHGTTGPWFHRSPERAVACAYTRPPFIVKAKRLPMMPKRRMHEARELLHKRQAGKCHWCGQKVRLMRLTVDHVIPRARGGSHDIENLVGACKPCNDDRGCDMPELLLG